MTKLFFVLALFLAFYLPAAGAEGTGCGSLGNGQCSETRPIYCDNGIPVPNCGECGCEPGWECEEFTQRCVERETMFAVVSEHGTEKNPWSRRQEYSLEFMVAGPDGKALSESKVSGLEVSLDGRQLEAEGDGKGIYSVKIEPGYRENDSAVLLLSALARPNREIRLEREFTVHFENEQTTLHWFFQKPFHEGESIGVFKARAIYEKGDSVEGGIFTAVLKAKNAAIEKTLELKNGLLECDFGYPLSLGDIAESPVIEVTGTDDFGNRIEKAIIVPTEEGKNPEFNLVVSEIADLYEYGATVPIRASVNSTQKAELKNTEVWVFSESLGLEEKIEFGLEGEEYYFEVNLPAQRNIEEFDLRVEGKAELSGESLGYLEEKTLGLTDGLAIKFIHPAGEVIAHAAGSSDTIVVVLGLRETGKPATIERVNATLSVNGEEQEIELVRQDNGEYSARLSPEMGPGPNSLKLQLGDGFRHSREEGEIQVTVQPQYPVVYFAGFIALIVAVHFLGKKIRKRMKRKSVVSEKEKFEIAKRERLLKDLRREYYKRHISEEEYKERAIKIQTELRELKKKPKEPGKEAIEREKMLEEIDKRVEEIKKKRKKGEQL